MIFNRKALSTMSVASVVLPLALSGSVYAAAATKPKTGTKPVAVAPMVSFSVSGNVNMGLRTARNSNAYTSSGLNAAASSADNALSVGMPGKGSSVVFKGCAKTGQVTSGAMAKLAFVNVPEFTSSLTFSGQSFEKPAGAAITGLTSAEMSKWLNPVNFEELNAYVGAPSVGTLKVGKFYALGADAFASSLGNSYLNGITDIATIPFAKDADGLYDAVAVTPLTSFAIAAQQGNALKVAYESPEFYKGFKLGVSYVPQPHTGEHYGVNHGSFAVAADYMGKLSMADVKAAFTYTDRAVQGLVTSAAGIDDKLGNEFVASVALASSGFDGGVAYSKFNFANKGTANIHYANADAWRVNVGYTTDIMTVGKTSFGAEYSKVKNAQQGTADVAGNASDAKVYEVSATHHMSNTQSFLKYVHADTKVKIGADAEVKYKPISAIVLGTNYSF